MSRSIATRNPKRPEHTISPQNAGKKYIRLRRPHLRSRRINMKYCGWSREGDERFLRLVAEAKA